ncbi:MAG: hypothetical protein F9K44_00460 [Hyphomicrobiaceae bacterium]|nr:MAG: hypothetical protein F9K44_00055 [Hyphomicrobiaceae bacterium]KAB2851830.1 MAG: hypothetical protein F9K44_00460 [Hyphomicrobiaceae bacterium]
MTAERHIDYEALAQSAMRGMVRSVLASVAKSGLPGEHHFYIAFNTEAPGVVISKRLKEKYPEEMTVVLQHRFWDLTVTEERFEVKLTFDSIPERLSVPFSAIKVFFDPSVPYGLQFEESDLVGQAADQAADEYGVAADGAESGPEAVTTRADKASPSPGPSPGLRTGGAGRLEKKPRTARRQRQDKTAEPAADAGAAGTEPATQPAPSPAAPRPQIVDDSSKVVRIDAFRKK